MNARSRRGTAQRNELVRQMLGEMADRLEATRPDEPITAVGRLALIQATTMDPVLTPALRELVPEITGEIVRRDYGARLREIADGISRPTTRAERVAVLREECAQDYAEGRAQEDLTGHRDDAHLIAGVSKSARARTESDH